MTPVLEVPRDPSRGGEFLLCFLLPSEDTFLQDTLVCLTSQIVNILKTVNAFFVALGTPELHIVDI